MRTFFSILIFVAFAIRPVIEVSNVLYYQLNIDVIVEKYCINKTRPQLNCNGKCYLMNQMKITSDTSDADNSNALSIIAEAFIPLFFQDSTILIKNKTQFILESEENWKPKNLLLENISKRIDYPPENYLL